MAGVLWWQIDSLNDLIVYRLEQYPMQTITETVTCSDGSTVVVVTTRLDGESTSDFVARHRDLVAALKA